MPSHDITRHHLAEVMLELAEKGPFDKITVADLARAAGVNRKTFYYHFVDKYDLLAWFVSSTCSQAWQQAPPTDFWGFYQVLADVMGQHRAFYKNVFSGRDKPHFVEALRRFLRTHIVRYVSAEHLQSIVADKCDECIDFLCATFATSLEEWLVNWPGLTLEDFIKVSQFDKIL